MRNDNMTVKVYKKWQKLKKSLLMTSSKSAQLIGLYTVSV